MATSIQKPDVFVKEEFVTVNPTLGTPALPVVLVGLNKQVEKKQDVGAYDSTSTSYAYPGLPTGAVVETASVAAYLTNEHGTFAIDSGDFSADADSVDAADSLTYMPFSFIIPPPKELVKVMLSLGYQASTGIGTQAGRVNSILVEVAKP